MSARAHVVGTENVFVAKEGGGAGNNWASGYRQGEENHEHIMEMAEGDEFLKTLWERKVRAQLQVAMKTVGIQNYESVRQSSIRALNEVIDYEVPKLRKMSDPFN